jgi:exodeoxyribonuclease VII large subunit
MRTPDRDIYTVSRLNRETRQLLEGNFPLIWLEGEISNLATPGSGHWYFTLKDQQAQIRAAMFRNHNRLLRFRPEHGMKVLVRARISLYEARGDFQLIVEHMEEAGDGALQRAYEELKHKLDQQGLFSSDHKQPLPEWPHRIGLVTSPSGAAIRDIVSIFRRRFPAIELIVYPTQVQGDAAPAQIVRALQTANERDECDALIITRGGGSLEDLWSFNDERVARAIFASQIPIVSAVGHEVDTTISDLVADQRAATPSAAAELLSPDADALLSRLDGLAGRLGRLVLVQQQHRQERLRWLSGRLSRLHPEYRLQQQTLRLDELSMRLQRACQHHVADKQARFIELEGRLGQHHPGERLRHSAALTRQLSQRLQSAIQNRLQQHERQLGSLSRELHSLSPLATLDRGYAIVRHDDKVVHKARQVSVGDQVETQLASGTLACTVDRILNGTKKAGKTE